MAKTKTDLVYKMAERAKILAEETLYLLRIQAADYADTPSQAQQECKHMSRGQCIEKILTDEFDVSEWTDEDE